MRTRLHVWLACLVAVIAANRGLGADWPMWRYDANRTAASPEALPDDLQLLWSQQFKPRVQVWDDPLNLDLMPYDRVFEPIVLDGRIFLGFNDSDKLMALDADTGRELWTFFTDGPVRLPPVGWQGRVYFCSDDGRLYCVDAETGELRWQFSGAPSSRKAIGNRRLVSAWPARGGPVIRDGHLYFAASIWPFMGTFVYALDAESGTVIWVNDSTGSQYIRQPHSAPSFAGVAPQGALVATETTLLVPGGRSVPAAFDRQTGQLRYFHINAGGKGNGGSFVAAEGDRFFVHTRENGVRAFELESGNKTAVQIEQPVLAGDTYYASASKNRQQLVRSYDHKKQIQWEVAADGSGDLIQAGDSLYAGGADTVSLVRLPAQGRRPEVAWTKSVDGFVARLLAADGKLIAVTAEGRVLAFGTRAQGRQQPASIAPVQQPLESDATEAAERLLASGDGQGYAIWFGAGDESLLDAVAIHSRFEELAIVEQNPDTVDRLRRRYDQAGIYGQVTVHRGSPQSYAAPPYVCQMVFVSPELSEEAAADPAQLEAIYASVRPYGGTLVLLASEDAASELARRVAALPLEQADVETSSFGVLVHRAGPLPGAADWTHQHGDIANTVKSNDSRVKLPLGVLWFGGNSNEEVLPRHGHGPSEQVIGGRLFVEGMNSLTVRDVYTGRLLWDREFGDLGNFDVYYDATFQDTPLNTAYNQVHIPGANARGTNFVATDDIVYVVEGRLCHRLDAASGELLGDISLPGDDPSAKWGFIGVYGDLLIGGAGFANYRARHGLSFRDADASLGRNRAGFGSKSEDRSASSALVGFDRFSGEVLWQVNAEHSFWHNGIVAGGGRVYCLDRNPQPVEDALRRRGESLPASYRIVAFDARSGEVAWQNVGDVFGTWLAYSGEFDLLLQAGAAGSDRLYSEADRGMAVYGAEDGRVKWQDHSLRYTGPCILHHDTILTNAPSRRSSAGAFSLIDGSHKSIDNPLTGEAQPWTISRAYGCNYMIASENLLTFRSGAAGFYDLLSKSGTGNLGGFKSGCTSNLVVANGVLNAPDYTRSCSCAYQNQTSLALVHMPEIEMWSVNRAAMARLPEDRIRQMGVNFGAPGDRRAESGILFLEYPEVAGDSARLRVDIEGAGRYFQRHSSQFGSGPLSWVYASGVESATSIRVGVGPAAGSAATRYRVRLYFSEPSSAEIGDRVFDVWLQGDRVLTKLDVNAETAAGERGLWKEFDDVPIESELVIKFSASRGEPILSGLELQVMESE